MFFESPRNREICKQPGMFGCFITFQLVYNCALLVKNNAFAPLCNFITLYNPALNSAFEKVAMMCH